MRLTGILLMLTVLLAQDAWSTPKADSIVAFTGSRTKICWKREAWCKDDYTPMSSKANPSLWLFDTDEGVERLLAPPSTAQWRTYLRISRSGRWLTWNEGTSTYIIDLTTPGATPKVFLSKANCTYWCARAMWADQANAQEYVFCLDNYDGTAYAGTGIVKVPFSTSTGIADLTKAVKTNYNGGGNVDDAIGVSSDGKKLGGAFPWPNTKILDIATGQLADRHEGMFGCQANLAPDNSYRFFHCNDEHTGGNMYDANLSTNHWPVDFTKTVPWNCTAGSPDFAAPRWTNHLQFITNTYPLSSYLDGDPYCYEGVNIFSLDAAGVKTKVKQELLANFFLAKFSSDFKTIEKILMVASDLRYFQSGGDGWIASGVTVPGGGTAASSSAAKAAHRAGLTITRNGDLLLVGAGLQQPVVVRIIDARGRLVQQCAGAAGVELDTKHLARGAYRIWAFGGNESISNRLIIGN